MRIILLLFLTFIVVGCNFKSDEINDNSIQNSLNKHQKDSLKQIDINRLQEIKKKYSGTDLLFIYDDFTESGYYSIKTSLFYNNPPSGSLWMTIHDNGDVRWASVYFARQRLYHTSIQAKINDSILTSDVIPLDTYSNMVEGKYVETVYFTNKDNGILNAIISSQPDANIRIRLLGIDNYTYSLKKSDIIKLKDGFEFAQLIKKMELSAKEQNLLKYKRD